MESEMQGLQLLWIVYEPIELLFKCYNYKFFERCLSYHVYGKSNNCLKLVLHCVMPLFKGGISLEFVNST